MPEIGFPFKPRAIGRDYLNWPLLPEIFPTAFPGVKTSRDDVVVDTDRDALITRMQQYFDPTISHAEMERISPGVMESGSGFDAIPTREYLLKRGFLPQNIVRYCYRPFDIRWLYWEPETKLLDRNRVEYSPHVFIGNIWLEARQRQNNDIFDRGYVSQVLSDNFGSGLSSFFPLYLRTSAQQRDMFDFAAEVDPRNLSNGRQLNLSDTALAYVQAVGSIAEAEALFYHSIAVLHAPNYRNENAGALRQDWPRIPLPATRELLLASAELGRRVAALLDSEQPVAGVTSGVIAEALRPIAVLSIAGGGQINPTGGDLDVTAGWGHAGRGGITMPGKGKTLERRAKAGEITPELGVVPDGKTLDVYLNERVSWRNVPPRVWSYTIGGYQVLKKWLSYRERPLLGRGLRVDEAREVTQIARRIAAILLLEPELDANYRAVVGATYRQ